MTRDEQDFSRKIKGYLDMGAAEMRPGTAYRLQQARAQALARVTGIAPVAQSRYAPALAGAGGGARHGLRRSGWIGIGVVVFAGALAFGYQEWRTDRKTREIADLDVQILTSDLPIDAYVDRGFQTWLTSFQR
ncbi:MAG: DUF3619 family protein [Burkholderiales bacterium]|nr:DUF3619 family protein [Burkholderiales bacterium]